MFSDSWTYLYKGSFYIACALVKINAWESPMCPPRAGYEDLKKKKKYSNLANGIMQSVGNAPIEPEKACKQIEFKGRAAVSLDKKHCLHSSLHFFFFFFEGMIFVNVVNKKFISVIRQ